MDHSTSAWAIVEGESTFRTSCANEGCKEEKKTRGRLYTQVCKRQTDSLAFATELASELRRDFTDSERIPPLSIQHRSYSSNPQRHNA